MDDLVRLTTRAPGMSLIEDETEVFTYGGRSRRRAVECRIRLWRAKDRTPIILLSQSPIELSASPGLALMRIARYCMGAILGFESVPIFFLHTIDEYSGERRLSHVIFEYIGHGSRLELIKPIEQYKPWSHLESIIGCSVEP